MRRVLVTGQGGQLATGLADALPARGFDASLVGQPDFDFVDPAGVARSFAEARPDAVVNCAAWTAVDAAEDQEPATFLVNALGPAQLARLCAAAAIPLIHISTDYVFDGTKGAPYVETDAPAPVSAYGRTKLAGEWAALADNPHTLVLRTAWMHAPSGRNFLDTMLRLGAEREELRVVADQRGAPTAAPDLADAIAGILAVIRDRGWQPAHRGVFHAVNGGETTWHGFAEAIFAAAGGRQPRVVPVTTADYPTKAHRPADSRLSTRKLAEVFGVTLPSWEEGLRRVLAARGQGAGARA